MSVDEPIQDALQDWRDAIAQGTFGAYLDSLDLSDMRDEDKAALLSELLLITYEERVSDVVIVDYVLDSFVSLRPPLSPDVPFSSMLIAIPGLNPAAISWTWLIKGIDLMTILVDSCRWMPNHSAALAMSTAVAIFARTDQSIIYDRINNPQADNVDLVDLIPVRSIGFLMDIADEKGCDAVYNWLLPFYAANGPPVGPGPWMIDASAPDPLPRLPGPRVIGDPVMVATDRLTGEVEDEQLNNAIGIIAADAGIQLSTPRREIYDIDDHRFDSVEHEIECFKIWGPSNPFFVAQGDDDDYENGEDRMFLCARYNYDEEVDDIQPVFNGTCDWKGHRISHERAALRLPVTGGGWEGSYCSFICMEEKCADMRGNVEDNVDAILSALDVMKQQLMQHGIYSTGPVSPV